ncbi:EamA-like transporter family protein [uncultured archaeon]|nr:EamA-like transporter family protein [uncultured archaeon]
MAPIEKGKGTALAYLTALVSGISVFANSFGVLTIDSTAYTFLKNMLVAGILAALALSLGSWREFLSLSRKQLLMLAFIGCIGGGAAFALYFAGLALTGGAAGSFLYRLLFAFAAIIAVGALKEKFSWQTALGVIAILAGNYILLGDAALSLSEGALLVLGATVLWAAEYAVSKKALEALSPTTVAAARMGIGSLVLLAILAYNGKIAALGQVSSASFLWIAIATGFLVLFVTLWYSALKHTSLISATAAFTLGGPVSALLSFALAGKALLPAQAAGFLVLALGAVAVVGASETLSALSWARERAQRLRL